MSEFNSTSIPSTSAIPNSQEVCTDAERPEECSSESVSDASASAFNDIEEKEDTTKKSNKLTIEDLAKTGEGPFKDVPKFMAEELEKAYSQYGVESGGYDLLCDETGLVKASMEDFETAYALEQLNGDQSRIIRITTADGKTVFDYDSDGKNHIDDNTFNMSNFETQVKFDQDGKLISQRLFDDRYSSIHYSLGSTYVELENGNIYSFDQNSNTLFDGKHSFKITYNNDGSVKDMKME